MVNLKLNKLHMVAAGSVVLLALSSAPASANHNHSIVGPAVAFIALSTLFHHNHHGHHYGHNRSYGHNRHHYKRHRRHSYSHGGYHNPRRKHH